MIYFNTYRVESVATTAQKRVHPVKMYNNNIYIYVYIPIYTPAWCTDVVL